MHGSDPATWEVETRGPEVQGRSQLHSKLEVSLDFSETQSHTPQVPIYAVLEG